MVSDAAPQVLADHVTAIVADADAASSALCRVLGVEPPRPIRVGRMDIRTFRLGELEIHVNAPTGPGPVRRHLEAHGPSLHHLALRVDDLDAFVAQLAERGLDVVGEPVETAPGMREIFLDPEHTAGLWVQLVERRGDAHDERPELDADALESLTGATTRPSRDMGDPR